MNEFTPEQHRMETASAMEAVMNAGNVEVYAAYVGLDVHKETIAVAIADAGPVLFLVVQDGGRLQPTDALDSADLVDRGQHRFVIATAELDDPADLVAVELPLHGRSAHRYG